MQEQIIHVVPFGNKELKAVESIEYEFLMSSHDVAQGYGVDASSLRNHKQRHSDELIEGKHFITVENIDAKPSVPKRDSRNLQQKRTLWTKKGIVRLGFFIKSEAAKKFRDWAEDYIINGNTQIQSSDIGALVGMLQQSMALQQQHNEMMMMSMNTMMEMMGQLTTMVGGIIETQSKTVKENLTRDQLDQIKLAVNRAAKPLADAHNFTWGEAVRYVYTELNGRMGVFSYYHISPSDFNEAIKLLERMREVKQYQADTGEMMLMNIEINLGGSK